MTRYAHLLAIGAFSLLMAVQPAASQQTSPAQTPPSTRPAPPQIPPPMPNPAMQHGELLRRWQYDATMKLREQADLFKTYRKAISFAECAQRVAPSRIADLLGQPLASSGERRATNSLIRFAPGCLGNSVVLSTRLLRGAVAEAVLENYRLADTATAREIQSDRMEAFLEATPGASAMTDETVLALTKMTQCQVLFAPGLARKVLDTMPESDAESESLEKLTDGARLCGRIEGKNHLATLVHRSYLAEALYHWTRSSGDSSKS